MTNNILRLHAAGRLNNHLLARAVSFGWLTETQYTELTGEPYTPPTDPYKDYYNAVSEELS